MKFRKKEQMFKDCPRCGIRCLATAETCNECGLVFSRMAFATNTDAKKKMKRGDKDYIIKTSDLPSDVSFTKLLCLCIFTGLVGGHCYYVGKYKQGIIQSVAIGILCMFVFFNDMIYSAGLGQTMEVVSILLGFTMMLWPIDLTLILMKKYKVAVAIDIDGDVDKNQQKEDYLASVKQVAQDLSNDLENEEKEGTKTAENEENALKQTPKTKKKGKKKEKTQTNEEQIQAPNSEVLTEENNAQNDKGSQNEEEQNQTKKEGEEK